MNVPFPPKQVSAEEVKREIETLQANVSRVIELRAALVANLVAIEEEAKRLLFVSMASPLDERPLIGISEMNFGQCAAAHVFSGIEVHVLDEVLRFTVSADARFGVSTYSGHGKTEIEAREVLVDGNPIAGIDVAESGTTLVAKSADGSELRVKTADVLALFVDKAGADWAERARLAGSFTPA
jgi:hypothetical protein